MKSARVIITLVLIFCSFGVFAVSQDSLLRVLDSELLREDYYVRIKAEEISTLSAVLQEENLENERKFRICANILEGYKSFHYDSAFLYATKLQSIASKSGDPLKIAEARIKLGFIFISSGMFKEASDTLKNVISRIPDPRLRAEYYSVMAIMHYSMADLQDQHYAPLYQERGHRYVDSVLYFSSPDSYDHQYYKGLRHIRKGEFDDGYRVLTAIISDTLSLHQKAIIHSTLSDIFINKGDHLKSIELLAIASICDIRSATKETAAILNLANILYQKRDMKRAYIYTKQALEDANFYGALHRKIQVGSILPIIEEEKINTVEQQKQSLLIYALIVSVLSLIIVFFIVIIYRQLKKLKKAEKEIRETNTMLLETNRKLFEAIKIKEEYFNYYFNINSTYIDKIENLKNSIEKNLASNKFDTVRYIVNSLDIKKERSVQYHDFDRVFLKLFPDFVKDFNSLFKEEDRIILTDNELLNTDLRIFALIRMGISENDKIARILGFSVNTIYAYKTRIKNKSLIPNEDFEKKIMEIRFI